ncbi:MAG: hypothetical protein VX700_08330 [Pseudomonadota bacterium]|nr:hypothetical protein [Pseudomonadota bacterium]
MKTLVVASSLFFFLALAIWCAVYVWNQMGEIEISSMGILAMIAGVVLSLGLGIGLMFLVFKSARDEEERQ